MDEPVANDENTLTGAGDSDPACESAPAGESAPSGEAAPAGDSVPALSKSARKKLLKKQRFEERKAEKKAAEKDRKRQHAEQRRREWEETLAAAPEEERERLVETRRETRRERIGQRAVEREAKAHRLRKAAEEGQKVVIDLEFADLMAAGEIHSLVQQGVLKAEFFNASIEGSQKEPMSILLPKKSPLNMHIGSLLVSSHMDPNDIYDANGVVSTLWKAKEEWGKVKSPDCQS